MPVLAAARIHDEIAHTSILAMAGKVAAGLVVGIAVGAAVAAVVAVVVVGAPAIAGGATIGAAATATVAATAGVGMSGLAVAAISGFIMNVSGLTDKIGEWTDSIGNKLNEWFPPTVTGEIVTGSDNVQVNSRKAARAAANLLKEPPPPPPVSAARQLLFGGIGAAIGGALLGPLGAVAGAAIGAAFAKPSGPEFPGAPVDDDKPSCSRHPPPQWLAEGSANVLINGQPAHRLTERTTCDAKTKTASHNVKIGGETLQVRKIDSEMPWWLKYAGLIGVALMACRGKWGDVPSKLGCLALTMGAGMLGHAAGDGYKWVKSKLGFPIHAATGAKMLQGEEDLDFALPARLPLIWRRYYNSLDTRQGLFGQGFSIDISVQLKLHQNAEYPHYFIDQLGREIPFEAVLPGTSFWNSAEGYRLACTHGGHYIVETLSGELYDFGAPPAHGAQILDLQRIEDRNGNYIALRRDDQGRLIEIADSAQRLYRLHYHTQHNARVTRVELVQADASLEENQNLPRTLVQYDYDSKGRLSTVINALGQITRRFGWHDAEPGANLMASQMLPSGLTCFYSWENYADHPRVVDHWTDDGQRWRVRYALPTDGNPGHTEVTDYLGRTESWNWNQRYVLLMYQNAVGEQTHLSWNPAGQLATLIQPNGGTWHYAYNEYGHLIQQTDPLGQTMTQRWRTDWPVLAERTEHGQRWQYHYDHFGNLYHVTDPAGEQTVFSHDDHGQVITQTDARGGIKRQAWNSAGQLTALTDCSGRTTQYDYDSYGALSTIKDAGGRTQHFHNDPLGRPVSVRAPDGGTQHLTWNNFGSLAQHADAQGAETIFHYDLQGRISHRTDALGHTAHYHYNSAGKLENFTPPGQSPHRFAYDAADRLIAQTDPASSIKRYELDALGLPILVQQGEGKECITIELKRDVMGRLIQKLTPETITHYHYTEDRLARIERHSSQDHAQGAMLDEVAFHYDALGRLIEETVTWHPPLLAQAHIEIDGPHTYTLTHAYDELGNRLSTTLPDGQRLNALYYGSGHLHQLNLDGRLISDIERDSLHREVLRSQGRIHTQTYYNAGGRISHCWAHRHPDHWHDSHLRETYPNDILVRAWDYNLTGECTARTEKQSGRQVFGYDALGRIQSMQQLNQYHDLDGVIPPSIPLPEERFAWDAAHNLLSATGPNLVRQGRLEQHGPITLRYDSHGRLTSKSTADPHTGRPGQEQTFVWNSEHQLTEVHQRHPRPSQGRYVYDALGRRIATHDGHTTTLSIWQGLQLLQQRLIQGKQHRPSTTEQILTTVYLPDSYTPVAQIESFTNLPEQTGQADQTGDTPAKPAPIFINHYHTSPNGTPEALSNEDGKLLWQARYAVWGKTQWEQNSERTNREGLPELAPQNLRMPGQWHDRESGLHYNTFRYYDPDIGRFISPDPIGLMGGENLYQYAPNPIAWIDPWGWLSCSLKNTPKKDPPKPSELVEMERQIGDILNGGGMPRIDKNTGTQTIFKGKLNNGQEIPKWKGALEWDVISGNNSLRILSKDLGNGKMIFGFSNDHYDRVFDVIVN